MDDKQNKLSLRVRCDLLNINRSGLYYKPVSSKDDDLCSKIWDIWLEHNNKGWRSIQADLAEYHDLVVNHKRVKRLMRKLGIHGILPKKNTSKSDKTHYKYPYLLKNMNIYRANQAWCSDISYVKLPQGHVYLVAIVDIYSRRILDYAISNTLEAEFCIRCLERCIQKYGAPVIFNTDQGVQYTSHEWINVLERNNIIISMDGKGRWADNVWIERVWRTIKYECIFMYGIENLLELKSELNKYISYYNTRRLHSSLGYKAPTFYYEASVSKHALDDIILYCEFNNSHAIQQAA
ncbi:MAG: IS3 family transposase [Burkholderiales bacterium]|nr:IS3 family transposase [Burkholderiales bacterium]